MVAMPDGGGEDACIVLSVRTRVEAAVGSANAPSPRDDAGQQSRVYRPWSVVVGMGFEIGFSLGEESGDDRDRTGNLLVGRPEHP